MNIIRNILFSGCCGALLTLFTGCGGEASSQSVEYFTARRGDMDIYITASGSVETAVSTNINQRIGRTAKIVTIVPEGTIITDEDVKNKRVLVQFDNKDIEDQFYERQTAYENASASAVTAEETLEIQRSSNESSIRKAELDVLYAESDLRRLVGEELANSFQDKCPEDINALLTDPRLGGSTLLDLTTYRSDIELAQTKLNRAEQTLEYTRKLYEKQFVSKNDFENDQMDVQSQAKTLAATKGKYEIFCRFDFKKNFQTAWATWQEAKVALVRAQADAKIRLTTAESRYRTARQTLTHATKRLDESREALENCTIYATAPGMVVYAKLPRWDNTGPIQSGKEIRNQQVIFTLPDLGQMQVKISINESQIDIIREGQQAVITVDALPGKSFEGKVVSKGILPSAENEWLNPGMKVYDVRVAFNESGQLLRPGMTATLELLIDRLKDVVYIPIHSVVTDKGDAHYCIMEDGSRRNITIGRRNRSFVQVLSGLEGGEIIRMVPGIDGENGKDGADDNG